MTEQTTEEREKVANQIFKAREYDSGKHFYTRDRNLEQYLEELSGLENFFKYVKDNKNKLGSNIVLDIGGGNGVAVKELKESPLTKGLQIKTTVLKRTPELKKNVDEESIYVTSAEKLRGIKDNSVAGIISVFGIMYSVIPKQAVESIDRVLVPGGIVKACFDFAGHEKENEDDLTQSPPETFAREFYKKNYDIVMPRYENRVVNTVLLAIKRPGFGEAGNLYAKDRKTI